MLLWANARFLTKSGDTRTVHSAKTYAGRLLAQYSKTDSERCITAVPTVSIAGNTRRRFLPTHRCCGDSLPPDGLESCNLLDMRHFCRRPACAGILASPTLPLWTTRVSKRCMTCWTKRLRFETAARSWSRKSPTNSNAPSSCTMTVAWPYFVRSLTAVARLVTSKFRLNGPARDSVRRQTHQMRNRALAHLIVGVDELNPDEILRRRARHRNSQYIGCGWMLM